MANIFDGLKNISNDDIIEQIALLETMNLTNMSKPIAQKAKQKTINIINFVVSKMGKQNTIKEPEVKEIWTLIDEKKKELKKYTRLELDEILLNVLMEKYKNDIEDPTEDQVSVKVIEEAGKLYKLHKKSTPAQKADNIYLKYCENLKGKAEEYLINEYLIDLKETTENIEETLIDIEGEQKKDVEQSVNVEKLTLLNAWRKIDRHLLARLVWLAVKACGGKFTPNEEILPSFMENEKEYDIIKQENDLKSLQEELIEANNKVELFTEQINSIKNMLKENNSLLKNKTKNKNESEEDIINLEKIKLKLEELKKSREDELEELKKQMEKENANLKKLDSLMEDFKNVKFDLIDTINKIFDINGQITLKRQFINGYIKEIESTEKNINKLVSELKQTKIEKDNLTKISIEKEQALHKKEELKSNEILERWSRFFIKFTFEVSNLSNVMNFTREELLHIEKCLYELHFTKDPMALSMGLIEDKSNKEEYLYIDVSLPNKFKFEIQYKVLDNEEKNIHIIEITTEL